MPATHILQDTLINGRIGINPVAKALEYRCAHLAYLAQRAARLALSCGAGGLMRESNTIPTAYCNHAGSIPQQDHPPAL